MSTTISKDSFPKKNDAKYIDLLDEDLPVAGQKFACLSFVSPEKILNQKEQYFLNQFLKQFDLSKSLEKFTQFLNFHNPKTVSNAILIVMICVWNPLFNSCY